MTRTDPYGRFIASDRGTRCYGGIVVATWAMLLVVYIFLVPQYVSPLKFPGPSEAISTIENLGAGLITHSASTLVRTIFGLVVGAVLGIATAVCMFAIRPVHAACNTVIEMIRPIPPIALTPFFILWFQLAPAGQIALIALGVFMVFVVSTYEALNQVSIDVRRAAWSLGCKGIGFYRHIMVPAIIPHLVGPARVAIALAFALACAAEFLGAQQGIGFLMMVARRTLETGTILVGVVIIGIQAAAVDWTVRTTIKRATRWYA